MKKSFKSTTKIGIYIITLVLSAVLLIVGHSLVYDREVMFQGGIEDGASKAVVTKIIREIKNEYSYDENHILQDLLVVFECEITSGEHKGEKVFAEESIQATDAQKIETVEVGDKIIVTESEGQVCDFIMYEYDRTGPLWVLGIVFVLLVLVFGGFKGVNTIVSLGFTCAAVFTVFLPSVMAGRNIYFWAIITCIYITVMTLLITNGYNRKTLSAIIGCSSGVLVSGILTVIFSNVTKLTGITSQETIYIRDDFNIDLKALIFGAIILGAVGAVMDVSMSISSSLRELYDQLPDPTFKGLFKSGITIGRDVMGTMANTLVLAYIGCELSSTVLLVAYNSSITTLFALEKIIVEVMNALVGSLGILLTIPLTAAVSSLLYITENKDPHKKDKYYVEPSEEPDLFQKTES